MAPYFEGRSQALAGVLIPHEFRKQSVHRCCFLLTSNLVRDRIGPIKFTAYALGYEPIATNVWAMRMKSSELTVQEVRLRRRSGVRFGALRLHLPEEMADQDLSPPQELGILRLRPDGWTLRGAAYLRRSVRLPAPEPIVLHGIPAGPYIATFANTLLATGAPLRHVRIHASRESVIDLSANPWGNVEVKPAWSEAVPDPGPAGRIFAGVLKIRVRFGKAYRYSQGYVLDRAPYRVVGLAPGTYRIVVTGNGLDPFVGDVEVQAGKTAVLPALLEPAK